MWVGRRKMRLKKMRGCRDEGDEDEDDGGM